MQSTLSHFCGVVSSLRIKQHGRHVADQGPLLVGASTSGRKRCQLLHVVRTPSVHNAAFNGEETGGSRTDTRPGAEIDDVLGLMVQLEPALEAAEDQETRRLRLQRDRTANFRKRQQEAAAQQCATVEAEARMAAQDAAFTGSCVGCGQRRVLGMAYSTQRIKVYSYRFKCGKVCESCHLDPPETEVDRAAAGALLRRQAWRHLTLQQQAAATCFGFSSTSWDARFGDNLPHEDMPNTFLELCHE